MELIEVKFFELAPKDLASSSENKILSFTTKDEENDVEILCTLLPKAQPSTF